ncbi:hypothetical protein PHYBLDRAFT_170503 [Phycomyces blakesleeanus NRRL 1555(-)]|uniref:Uncharacterized protein n=1 Tax=Phycomyces blakesleeanus (strain ATCC 8743b / DSM 1359 / FGSC 10004 / NBRC 33097 / NRRL 1555) TaxID=763407 RepID=A0A162WVJ0_PHYB8|nr:hypothetical protein PHYBLDRAFT_170503 [Phycomyces blakesleeanus NRRL 1555(-)]OAD71115.1 hypothetical protein PHYBLDRAFT_170503 [Phycomyces blakesleeanus NRRL 1555(-)]|eukprot:XP_018289155.1 hypothetical protein PHYBLDRAFT_170503 [Phycomyces blakesleeanus NRRL 1555(-)]
MLRAYVYQSFECAMLCSTLIYHCDGWDIPTTVEWNTNSTTGGFLRKLVQLENKILIMLTKTITSVSNVFVCFRKGLAKQLCFFKVKRCSDAKRKIYVPKIRVSDVFLYDTNFLRNHTLETTCLELYNASDTSIITFNRLE